MSSFHLMDGLSLGTIVTSTAYGNWSMRNFVRVFSLGIFLFFGRQLLNAQWMPTKGPCAGSATAFGTDGRTIFLGSVDGGIFRSTDRAQSWESKNTGIPSQVNVRAFLFMGPIAFAGTEHGVFMTKDNGETWSEADTGLTCLSIRDFAFRGNTIYAAANSGGIFLSNDTGQNWQPCNSGLGNGFAYKVAAHRDNLFAVMDDDGKPSLYRTTRGDLTWAPVLYDSSKLPALFVAVVDAAVYAVTWHDVFRSSDAGYSWQRLFTDSSRNFRSFAACPGTPSVFLAGLDSGFVGISTDEGLHWRTERLCATSRQVTAAAACRFNRGSTVDTTILLAATNISGFFHSTDKGFHWEDAGNNMMNNTRVLDLLVRGDTVFAVCYGDGVYISTDLGETWSAKNLGISDPSMRRIVANDACLYASSDHDVYKSSDRGEHWTSIKAGLPNDGAYALAVSDSELFVSNRGCVYLSSDEGNHWVDTKLCKGVISFQFRSGILYAGTESEGIIRTTDNGNNWQWCVTIPAIYSVSRLACTPRSPGTLYAAGRKTVLRSIDAGIWTPLDSSLKSSYTYALAVRSDTVFVGSSDNGVCYSVQDGKGWKELNNGLPNLDITALTVAGNSLLAGTYGNGVWRHSLTELTSESQAPEIQPKDFHLEQNYPNPFSSATTIRFTIPHAGYVNVKIYSILGNEVATLISNEMPAGTHETNFSAATLPSGVYLCRLQADSFTDTRTLVLFRQ